jgi:hypothetical protein
MAEDHGWMKGGAHTKEWTKKTQEFINRAFSSANNGGIKCPCSRCRNSACEEKRILSLHIFMVGFKPGYELWVHHGESVRQASLVEEEDDSMSDDRMDEMLDAIWLEFETNPEDPPTLDVQKFFDILRAAEEPLQEHMIVSILSFLTRLMAIKSKFAFSNNCYKDLLSLISDVLPMNHKILKERYQ